jgi:hypothetical protein
MLIIFSFFSYYKKNIWVKVVTGVLSFFYAIFRSSKIKSLIRTKYILVKSIELSDVFISKVCYIVVSTDIFQTKKKTNWFSIGLLEKRRILNYLGSEFYKENSLAKTSYIMFAVTAFYEVDGLIISDCTGNWFCLPF